MSGSGQNHPSSGLGQGNVPPAAGSDPSMEDILASIRRILSEDDGVAGRKPAVAPAPSAHEVPGFASATAAVPAATVLTLDESMLVRAPVAAPTHSSASLAALGSFMSASTQPDVTPRAHSVEAEIEQPPSHAADPVPPDTKMQAPAAPPPTAAPPSPPVETSVASHDDAAAHMTTLVAPEAAAAAAASMGTLIRTLTAERHTAVYRGGPTLEDMVRDEMRPMLKEWLDANVPAMVERIVRSEIERMAGRVAI